MSEKRFNIKNGSSIPVFSIYTKDGKELSSLQLLEILNEQDGQINQMAELLNEQQATINELQSIINHIKCEENCFDYDYCCETVCSLYNEIKHLKEENEQLRTQLLVCQQSKSDNGRIKVWQVPPIPKGMRITTSTTFNGEKDE